MTIGLYAKVVFGLAIYFFSLLSNTRTVSNFSMLIKLISLSIISVLKYNQRLLKSARNVSTHLLAELLHMCYTYVHNIMDVYVDTYVYSKVVGPVTFRSRLF